jgi:uncharacterized protein
MIAESNRFYVVDALRGFAIISIMLLHNIEHFDYYFTVDNIPEWMAAIDQVIWTSLFFLFGGKSYAMFALLFGLTFYIQMHNQEKRGSDFRTRFVWRLFLLLMFGIINSAFFQGDILSIYAVVGLFLIPVAKMSDRVVFIIATILFLQPLEIIKLIIAIQNPDMQLSDPASWAYFGKMGEYIPGNSLWETIKGNLTNGKTAVLLWNWENGRYFHILSLFMFGMLAGRRHLFAWNSENKNFWTKTLITSSILFVPLFAIKSSTGTLIHSEAIGRSFSIIQSSWTNICFMVVLLSGFVLLFHSKSAHKTLNIFTPIGKMSLSNYIFQSLIGTMIYYGFGFSLYKYANTSLALLMGITLAIGTWMLCSWWVKKFKRGPLETLWHSATWVDTKK